MLAATLRPPAAVYHEEQHFGWWLYAILVAAGAWVLFAEHPTARNARRAIVATIGL